MQDKKKAFVILLAFAIALVVLPNLSSAEASTVKRYRDYSVEDLGNGYVTQTFGLPQYVWDGTNFVDRIIQNNGTHYNVYSEMGSFSFNKASCTITQYVKGFDPTTQQAHDSDIVIKNWFWTIERKNGANPWSVIDASIFGCSISPSQNATGKYLGMTRTHPSSGSTLKVNLAAPEGRVIEDFGELYMNVTAWSGNKFAPVLWAKDVKADTLTFRNGTTIQIPNGVTNYDKSQLTVKSMDFIKNGNAFFFDWGKMSSQFQTLTVNKTGTNVDVLFNFNANAVTLTTGQKMSWDPYYGYTSSGATNNMFYYDGTAGTKCQNSVSGTATRDTGDALNLRLLATGVANGCQLPIPYWNISTIPTGVLITDTKIRIDNGITTFTNFNTAVVNFNEITHRPDINTPITMYQDGANISNGTSYLTSSTSLQSSGADVVIDLGTSADSNVQSQLNAALTTTKGWFGVGIMVNGTRDASPHIDNTGSGAGTIDLQVTYFSTRTIALKPMRSDNSTSFGNGYVNVWANNTLFSTGLINSTGYGTSTVYDSVNFNYTVKTDTNWVVNKTINKLLKGNFNKQGPVNVFGVSVDAPADKDFLVMANYTNYHNMTWITAPNTQSNDDISGVVRFVKQGFGPSANSTTKVYVQVLDTTNFNWCPSGVTYNGTRATYACYTTGGNYIVNATGIQVANGYNSVRLNINIITDNRTSKPLNPYTTIMSSTSIKINWSPPSANHGDAPQGYRILYGVGASTTCTPNTLLVNSTTALNYNQTGLGDAQYCYYVYAWNRIGLSPPSSIVYRYHLPDAVTDLSATSIGISSVDVAWTSPNSYGATILGYRFNYTTPSGTPNTILVNNTGTNTTAYSISSLSSDTSYSFRIAPWTRAGTNASGNILDVTTFATGNFTIGYFSMNATNPDLLPIRFEASNPSSGTTQVNVIYPRNADMYCTVYFSTAQLATSYANLTATSFGPTEDYSTFTFNNSTNDVTTLSCINLDDNSTARYVIAQNSTQFPLIEMINNFRNGTYGTHGLIGGIDLVTYLVIVLSMIGFNRLNEAVGVIFNCFFIGILAWFHVIEFPTIFLGAILLILMLTILSTRKD